MLAIFKKEVRSFFSSSIGFLIIGMFLILMGLFLWVFKGQYNIFEYGFADLNPFFLLAPWIFLFFIPALTMKSFSEEKSIGTLELLFIKPISTGAMILAKFLGTLAICILALIPTLLYVWAIGNLGILKNNYDLGIISGSYFGLLFLIATFIAVGVFSSSLARNQIAAFLLGVLFTFLLYFGFEALATLFQKGETQRFIASFGAKAHFESVARGVLDTKDLLYFLSVAVFFLFLTKLNLKKSLP